MTAENRLPKESPFRFTNIPAELRERIIEELKTRPEFTQVFEASVQGPGVSLSLTLPEPIEFTYAGVHFHAFNWMGQIHVMGSKEPPEISG